MFNPPPTNMTTIKHNLIHQILNVFHWEADSNDDDW